MSNKKADVRFGDGSIRERIRKDGGVSYQARWHDGLKMRAKTFHGSIEQAEDFLRQRGRDVRTGKYVADEDVTLLQAVDEYLERAKVDRDWRTNTQATYRSVRDVFAEYPLAKMRLSDITTRHCQLWKNEMVKRYSPSRLIVVRAVVSGALSEAQRLGTIQINPMNGIRWPSPERREYSLWTQDQGREALLQSKGVLHTYYLVAMMTGMRPGEIRALLWTDINLDTGIIKVSSTMTRGVDYSNVRGDTTKGGSSRSVVITEAVIETLRAHKADQNTRRLRAEHWHNAGYVFDRGNGGPMPQQTIWRKHREFSARHGLPICRLHDLRHFAATAMFHAGVNIKVISETLGHKTVRTTEEVYAHVDEKQQREVADLMGEVLSLKRKVD